ncbi:winged helix-turn-helix domain-containing protein [Aeromonas hydrophila]|uniref:winged helix-turn-helix domain-containing protein n=1 Tax=Aeromonas hydrophila TaxID=644 RepID=UPI003EC62B1E
MWLLDINSGDISRDGNKVARLNSSETNILVLLISNHGSLVSKDLLLDCGWPQKFVAPNSLTVAIKNIRKSLCLSQATAYIETVHRKGYIFHDADSGFEIVNIDPLSNKESLVNNDSSNISQVSSGYEVNIEDEVASDHACASCGDVDLRPTHKKYFWGMKVLALFFCVAYIFFSMLAIYIYTSTKELICYDIDGSSVCGLFELKKRTFDNVKQQVVSEPGKYLYGYTKDLKTIEVYRID